MGVMAGAVNPTLGASRHRTLDFHHALPWICTQQNNNRMSPWLQLVYLDTLGEQALPFRDLLSPQSPGMDEATLQQRTA